MKPERVSDAMPPVLTPLGYSIWQAAARWESSPPARGREIITQVVETREWYAQQLKAVPRLDLSGTQRMLAEACEHFVRLVQLQARGLRMGADAESTFHLDLWELGRTKLTLSEFIERHGYRGPSEGEVSGRVWRDDPTHLIRLAVRSSSRPESDEPPLAGRRGDEGRRGELISLSWALGESAFLQAMDVARITARRMGELLAREGVIGEAAHVFSFAKEELIRGLAADTTRADPVHRASAVAARTPNRHGSSGARTAAVTA